MFKPTRIKPVPVRIRRKRGRRRAAPTAWTVTSSVALGNEPPESQADRSPRIISPPSIDLGFPSPLRGLSTPAHHFGFAAGPEYCPRPPRLAPLRSSSLSRPPPVTAPARLFPSCFQAHPPSFPAPALLAPLSLSGSHDGIPAPAPGQSPPRPPPARVPIPLPFNGMEKNYQTDPIPIPDTPLPPRRLICRRSRRSPPASRPGCRPPRRWWCAPAAPRRSARGRPRSCLRSLSGRSSTRCT